MATLKTKTVETTATVETVNPDLIRIEKSGQASNAARAVDTYITACREGGKIAAKYRSAMDAVKMSVSSQNGGTARHTMEAKGIDAIIGKEQRLALAKYVSHLNKWKDLSGAPLPDWAKGL